MEKRYYRVTDGTDEVPNNILAFWLRQRHAANPDLDQIYTEVAYWFVEVEKYRVIREVGFGAEGEPILAAPLGRNPGTWTTIELNFVGREGPAIDEASFLRGWESAVARLKPTISPQAEDELR